MRIQIPWRCTDRKTDVNRCILSFVFDTNGKPWLFAGVYIGAQCLHLGIILGRISLQEDVVEHQTDNQIARTRATVGQIFVQIVSKMKRRLVMRLLSSPPSEGQTLTNLGQMKGITGTELWFPS